MLAPGAVLNSRDAVIPIRKLAAETAPEVSTTPRKLLHIRIAVSVGITIRLDMSSAPIIIIPRTTVIAVRTAKIIL